MNRDHQLGLLKEDSRQRKTKLQPIRQSQSISQSQDYETSARTKKRGKRKLRKSRSLDYESTTVMQDSCRKLAAETQTEAETEHETCDLQIVLPKLAAVANLCCLSE